MTYLIVEHVSRRVVGPLDSKAVCTTLRVFCQMFQDPDFDVLEEFPRHPMQSRSKKDRRVVTEEFVLDEHDGTWSHQPPPGAAERAT